MTKHIFDCIDAHTCGNPVRLILSQKPDLAGSSMSQKRSDFIKNFDWIRKSLMFEPRGHDIMSGGMIFPPNDPNNDFDWTFNYNSTRSVNTGPTFAYEGIQYLYTEASNSNHPSKRSSIISPCLNLSQYNKLSFKWINHYKNP